MTDRLAMHRQFLAEIQEKYREVQGEMEKLEAVRDYHEAQVQQFVDGGHHSSEESPMEDDSHIAVPKSLTKHEACVIAMQNLGGRATTADVVDWLTAHKYGAKLERKILRNACFTAMNRKDDLFRKAGTGTWELVNQNGSASKGEY